MHLLAKNLSLNNITHEVSRVRTAELEGRCPVTVDGLDWLAVHGLFIIAKKSEKGAITAVSSSCLCPRGRGLGVAGAPACSAVRAWRTEIADY